MIESITLAEFHDTEGSKCILKYPSSLHSDAISLENYILPEGLHNHSQDSSLALIRRPQKLSSIRNHPKYSLFRFQSLSQIHHKVELFKYYEDWFQISPVSDQGSTLKISEKSSKFYFDIENESNQLMSIELHGDLQFTVLEHNFASLYTVDGQALGIFFKSNTLKELDCFITFAQEGKFSDTEKKIFGSTLFYCFSVGRIKKSADKQRGVQIMGLGAISPSKYIVNLDSVLVIALDKIMENPKKSARVLKKLFNTINSVPWPAFSLNEPEKKVLKNCIDQGYQTEPSSTIQFEYDGLKIFTEFNKTLFTEEVIEIPLKKLLDTFQDDLIKIYTCLIQSKRIIIFSKNKPCHYICNMTLAVARLISPPVPFIVKQHLHPYVTLSDLDFLNSTFFIAGANNPLFKHREQWWDLLADLDTGEVITTVPVPKLFKDFMKNLQENLTFDPNPDLLLKSQFFDFTQHVIDSILYPQVFESFDNKLSDFGVTGEVLVQYSLIRNQNWGFVGYEELYVLLLRLRLMHITEKMQGIEKVYKEIYNAIKDKRNLTLFLSFLPNCGDLHCVAAGFFIENVKAWRYACKILTIIEEDTEGKYLVMLVQPSELNAYIAYKNRI